VSFESDLARLDAIVAELDGDVDLERAMALFQEGVERLRSASVALTALEGRVRMLVEREDGSFGLEELGG
jgi:exodeoxyribonuclease VII small subunit